MPEERVEKNNETQEERHLRHKKLREKRKEKTKRKIVVLSFIMSLALFSEVFFVSVYAGFFSTSTAKRLSGDFENYSHEAYGVVIQRLESLSIKYGLTKDVFDDVVTQDRVNVTLDAFLNDLSDSDFSNNIPTDDISKGISENVQTYLKDAGVKIDDTVVANIKEYVSQCVKIYQNTLIFTHFRTIRQMKMYIFYVVIVATIFNATAIAICVILINKYLERKRQILRFIIYAAGTSCILTFIPSFLIYNRIIPIYISGMKLEFQYNLIMNYFYNCTHTIMSMSYILFALYLTLLASWYYIATTKRNHI